VIFLVFLVVLQQLEGNLIYPRVVGQSVGLPGLWVLTAVSVGGTMLGVAGMLLSVPVGAALYRLLREELQRRETAGSDSQPPQISQTGNAEE
jgi:predicted PurR-regulated permease PerM